MSPSRRVNSYHTGKPTPTLTHTIDEALLHETEQNAETSTRTIATNLQKELYSNNVQFIQTFLPRDFPLTMSF